MENATEALQMAFGVLVFVIALSISINAFGEARQSAQIILDARDREYDYSWVENNDNSTERIVSAETIIPSIYKAYKENYKMVFKKQNGEGLELYQKLASSNSTEQKDVCSIDLEKDVVGSDEQKEKFIRAWLYSEKYEEDVKNLKISGIFLESSKNFYQTIKNKKFKESLGVYYQEELEEETNTPNANKTKKRVITYQEI